MLNPTFFYKQIIPYIIFQYCNNLLSYRRGRAGEEHRLHGDYSIGVWGHILFEDSSLTGNTYTQGIYRELNEEVFIDTGFCKDIAGLINDDSNDAGKVHFGIVHFVRLTEPRVYAKEAFLEDMEFV